MLTTTEYRTHWIDSAGRCYAQRHPFVFAGQLAPVVNLDEVRAWLTLAASEQMRQLDFPGARGEDDPAVHYLRLVLDRGVATDDHLAAETARELTDNVPRYSQSGGRDWATPFMAMRETFAPPPATGPVEIRNLTPHQITVGDVTIAPSGTIARVTESSTPAAPLYVLVGDAASDHPGLAIPSRRPSVYAASHEAVREVATTTTRYTGTIDLPDPEPGVYLVVSMLVPPVVAQYLCSSARARWTGDLLTPGQQVRDASGRVVGCQSLLRVTQ